MIAKLGDIGQIITGNTPKTADAENYASNDICFVKPSDISDDEITQLSSSEFYISETARNKARILPKESILVTCIGIIGKIAINHTECAFNQQINAIIPDLKKCITNYLAYALQYQKPKLQDIANAPIVPILNKSQFSNVEIKIPTIENQLIVATSLDKVTDLISLRKQQLSKLDELVKSQFIEMFGDPVMNPMGWPECTFSDITSSRLGKMLDGKQQTGKCKYPYLANYNVQWFHFDLSKMNEMDFDEGDRLEFELKNGDLLVCEGGEVGRCAVWRNEIDNCYFQKAVHRVRCDLDFVLPEYLVWWFKFRSDYNRFEDIVGSKSTIAHLPGVKLKKLQVVVPPVDLQKQFATILQQVDKSKFEIRKSLEKLETLKKALMQQYFG